MIGCCREYKNVIIERGTQNMEAHQAISHAYLIFDVDGTIWCGDCNNVKVTFDQLLGDRKYFDKNKSSFSKIPDYREFVRRGVF